jgi:hypothetical protein
LSVLGAVAAVEGARGVVQGVDQVIGAGPTSANVDSEFRFYSAWYHVCGVLLLRAARKPETETATIQACAGGFLLAATGRVLAIRRNGPPHPLQRGLMALEFVIPAIIVPWQAQVARRGKPLGRAARGSNPEPTDQESLRTSSSSVRCVRA